MAFRNIKIMRRKILKDFDIDAWNNSTAREDENAEIRALQSEEAGRY